MRTVPPPGFLPLCGPPAPLTTTPWRPSFFQPMTLSSTGATSSAWVGANSTSCSRRSTSPDGVRWPFMIRERWPVLMPASRATWFCEYPWASIRSHRVLGSTVGHCAASTVAGASSTASTLAWTPGLKCLFPLDAMDM